MSVNRRNFIRLCGVNLFLPYLSPLAPWLLEQAHAETTRTNFVALYFPNGAYMPLDENSYPTNGDWTWNGALQPFVDAGLQNNIMILRKLHNGFNDRDPHWQNVAGMMSGRKIVLDPNNPKAGESIDQTIARTRSTFHKSLIVGPNYYHIHELADHPTYSSLYTNRISYDLQGRPMGVTTDPAELFAKLFTVDGRGPRVVEHLRQKKKSILDVALAESNALKNRLPTAQKDKIDLFQTSVRSVEQQLSKARPACDPGSLNPAGHFTDFNATFVQRAELLNRIVCLALQCGVTNVASVMYGPSISSHLNYSNVIGNGEEHHSTAHNGGDQGRIARMKNINRLYSKLHAHFLTQLRTAGILNNSLVYITTDMSNGDTHHTTNIPTLLAGGGGDLKFGQEIVPQNQQPSTNLLLKILQLTGVSGISSLGEGETQSTGPLELIKS